MVMMWLNIAKTGMEFLSAQQQASADEARYQQNRIAAVQARDLQIQQLNKRAIQESEATAQSKFDLAIKALEVSEAKKVAAGRAGVAGQSVEQSIAMTEAKKLRGTDTLKQNLSNLLSQIELEKAGVSTQALNRINSLPRGEEPNLLAYGLQAASGAVEADIKYNSGELFGIGRTGLTGDNTTPLPRTNDFNYEM
tara:strand:- start:355 stop:939 length:585 start_codon:yes stop_codon:yes gene_type:complete